MRSSGSGQHEDKRVMIVDIHTHFDELVGRPFDTTMCLARMFLSGLFDRFPALRLSVAHMAAGSCRSWRG